MKLDEYVKALGHTEGYFAMHAGVPTGIFHTVKRGDPIAESYARKICAYLSKEFERPIQITDIKDIKTC